jgi:hypothetical protein
MICNSRDRQCRVCLDKAQRPFADLFHFYSRASTHSSPASSIFGLSALHRSS